MLTQVPGQLDKLLRGAGRAGGRVIADEAKDRSISHEVREAIEVRVKSGDGKIRVGIGIRDPWARSLGTWLEYGTEPHFISVDDSQREGRSIGRINRLGKAGSLAINGEPIGTTVHHPGARAHPFLRVSLDTKEAEAIAAAQGYISARVKPSGIETGAEGDDA